MLGRPLAVTEGGSRGMLLAAEGPSRRSDHSCGQQWATRVLRSGVGLSGSRVTTIGMATQHELADNLRRARMFSPLSIAEARRVKQVGEPLARKWADHFGPIS